MEASDNKTQDGLKLQMQELEEELALLNLAYDYIGQNILVRFFKGTLYMLAKLVFYLVFIITVIAFVALLTNIDTLLSILQNMARSQDGNIIFLASVIVLLGSMFNLLLGLFLFRKLRNKKNQLQDAAEIFEKLIELANYRKERINGVKRL